MNNIELNKETNHWYSAFNITMDRVLEMQRVAEECFYCNDKQHKHATDEKRATDHIQKIEDAINWCENDMEKLFMTMSIGVLLGQSFAIENGGGRLFVLKL